MNLNLTQISASAVVLVPVIVAIVQAIKMLNIKGIERFAPLISIGVGIIIGFLADHNNADLTATILSGAMYGLMASGLYSGLKTTMAESIKSESQNQSQSQNKSQQNQTSATTHCTCQVNKKINE